jgi:hypothetical protein
MQKLVKMALHSAAFALPLGDARWAVDSLERGATTTPERIGADLGRLALRFAEGRTDDGYESSALASGAQWSSTLIQQALIEPAHRAMAATVLARETAGRDQPTSAGSAIGWPPVEDCFGTLFRVASGDVSGAAVAIRRLRAFAAGDHPTIPSEELEHFDLRVCPLLLQVLSERPPALPARCRRSTSSTR